VIDVVILSQGNELTTGLTLDTNAHFLAGQLQDHGLRVRRVVTVPDRMDDLVDVLRQAAELAPVVVSTGGLGPTRDDLTAQAAAAAFGRAVQLDPEAMAQVEARYAAFGRRMPAVNRRQAELPEGAKVWENRWGTAPGFSVDVGPSRLYFLPGVPREMRPMFTTHVLPDVLARHALTPPLLHTIRVIGLGESTIEERLQGLDIDGLEIGFRTKMPENQVKLAFVPGTSASARQAAIAAVRERIGWQAFGVDSGDLAEVLVHTLVDRGQTISLAESCTAGGLAAWLGAVPGASQTFMGGAVVYSNAEKVRQAGVPEDMLIAHGAVSEPVARALAEGMRARVQTTWAIGITGVAGPGGGSPEKPVGTVHYAVAGPDGTTHRCDRFPGDRSRVQRLSAAAALAMLYKRTR
jgi:nicotinamide-nucleotide amidase